MIYILKRNLSNDIIGWIIATDLHDARRKALNIYEGELALMLYRIEQVPPPGAHEILVYSDARYTMLVN